MAHRVLTAAGNTTTTTGQGTVDLIDTAPTGYGALQTIADALGDSEITSGDTVDYHLLDANGTAWESGRGTITNAATDTLSRDTVYRSSAASDAKITLTSGTHTILFSPSSHALTAPRGHIEFDSPQYMYYDSFLDSTCDTTNTDATVTMDDTSAIAAGMIVSGDGIPTDTTVSSVTNGTTFELSANATANASNVTLHFANTTDINIVAGRGWIDDEYLSWSAITHTPTLTENGGLMYVYLYNNSGTVAAEAVDITTADIAWDTDRGFWVKSGDTTRRCIGWILAWEPDTGGSGGTERIAPYTAVFQNRQIHIAYTGDNVTGAGDTKYNVNGNTLNVVTDSANTASVYQTAFDFVPTVTTPFAFSVVPTAMITHWVAAVKMKWDGTSGTDDGIVGVSPIPVVDTIQASGFHYSVRASSDNTSASDKIFFGRYDIPYYGENPVYGLHFISGTITVEIECWGARATI